MIELMLVVVIGLLAAGVAIPLFARSLKAQRLRSSVRTVVTAGRYARSNAVLRQVPMALLLDTERQRVDVVAIDEKKPAENPGVEDVFPGEEATATAPESPAEAEGDTNSPLPQIRPEIVRRLEEGVRMVAVETKGEIRLVSDRANTTQREYQGVYWSMYQPNGMCEPYGVVLEDARGDRATITIDPITGGATVEMAE